MTKKPTGKSIFYDFKEDLRGILAYHKKNISLKTILWAIFGIDAYIILVLFRIRKWSVKYHIPGVNRILRGIQTFLYAVELGIDIELGHGVYFIHSLGTVVGGTAKLGNRCVLYGCNTVGAAKFVGSPTIGNNVLIGAGARVLGEITIGSDVFIGANAVVLNDVKEGEVVVGLPAKPIKKRSA